ncbi:adenine deaminase [bacterium]|nr:adenine deaminase [bacterium]
MNDSSRSFILEGSFVFVAQKRIASGKLYIVGGKVGTFEEGPTDSTRWFTPGFVDAHIHIESSLLVPTEFARLALPHGTVATVSDPHEIANVLGVAGVQYMLENARRTPLKILFGAPPCVPATCSALETAGAELTASDLKELFQEKEIGYLAEVMNFPAVLSQEETLMEKIQVALEQQVPIDGHFPGGRGRDAQQYIEAGRAGEVTISTDHECFTIEEARDKLSCGMKIAVREGSAAQNLEALHPLFSSTDPENLMLCSDDRHPDTLAQGHINELLRRLVEKGHDPLSVITSATATPKAHYSLDIGLLEEGDPADIVELEDLTSFRVLATYINGEQVAKEGQCLLPSEPIEVRNNFSCTEISPPSIRVSATKSSEEIRVIDVLDGEIVTAEAFLSPRIEDGEYRCDLSQDLLKLVVINRYHDAPPAAAFCRGFTLRQGAIASSVAHDCHNIIAVGTNDEDICAAVNLVIEKKGGLSLAAGEEKRILPLPVGGIMSDRPAEEVVTAYTALDTRARELGSSLRAPYMSLSFLALLVIPELKLSDKGLFSGKSFGFVSLVPEKGL